MYCINCGAKLADTEKCCPLCKTEVYHPTLEREEGEPLYPKDKYPQAKKNFKWPQVMLTCVFLIPLAIVLLCDIKFNSAITWSGYVIGALIFLYVCTVLPSWFKKPNPVIFVPCGFATAAVFLLYICYITDGNWFLTFALPVIGGFAVIVTTVVTLLRYLKRGRLYIAGGATLATGAFMLPTEILINLTFGFEKFIGWSLYPLVTLFIIGALLLFFAICRPAREDIERRFFI